MASVNPDFNPESSVEVFVPAAQEIVYPTDESAIEAMKAEYMALVVTDENDKEGAKKCYEARQNVKQTRIKVDKRRVELNADALKHQRAVNERAKTLVSLLTPIELHLQKQEDIVELAKQKAREKMEAELNERFRFRCDALSAVAAPIPHATLRLMPNEEWATLIGEATAKHKAEQERQAAIEAENAKLKAEKDARDKADREAEQQRKLQEQEADAERRKLQSALDAARERELAEERRQKEAAEAAVKKVKDEADALARKAENDRLESERKLQAEKDRAAKEKADAEAARVKAEQSAKKAEDDRIKAEADAKLKAEEEAAAKIKDAEQFAAIKAAFPTAEAAWVEIHRLNKIVNELSITTRLV